MQGNTRFRENGCKMIINKNGLTNSRVPRSVEKNLFFWPALFPDAILALRQRLFFGKKPTFRPMALMCMEVLIDQNIISEGKRNKLHENSIWKVEASNPMCLADAKTAPFRAVFSRFWRILANKSVSVKVNKTRNKDMVTLVRLKRWKAGIEVGQRNINKTRSKDVSMLVRLKRWKDGIDVGKRNINKTRSKDVSMLVRLKRWKAGIEVGKGI